MGEVGQFADLRGGGLSKKEGDIFEEGGGSYPNALYEHYEL